MTSPIRGRTGELQTIDALASAVAHGRGGVLVIEGPPGIGKSRLLAEAMRLAEKSRVRTLFGEAFEYQQSVPFFPLFMATLRADPPVGDGETLRLRRANRAVADQLHLSQHTVKTHVHNAFAKLGISSRAQLAELMS
jgi:predicted ATPase